MARWTERNRWRKGRHLVVDDESGFVHYDDQMVRRWDGMIVHRRWDEPIDPQWFISSDSDPKPVHPIREEPADPPMCDTISPYDPAGNLLKPFPGYAELVGTSIGTFEIECSFVVYPDDGPFPAD